MENLPALLDDYINEEKVGYRSNHRWARKRLKACVLLMASTGMRPAEMRNLRVRDLVFEEHNQREVLVVKIGRTKGGTKTIPHNKSKLPEMLIITNRGSFSFFMALVTKSKTSCNHMLYHSAFHASRYNTIVEEDKRYCSFHNDVLSFSSSCINDENEDHEWDH